MTEKKKKSESAVALGKLSAISRFKGKTKKQRSKIMSKLAQKRWAKPKND